MAQFKWVGAMRVKLIPLGDRKFRLEYLAVDDPEDRAKLRPEPVFFEEFEIPEDKVSWVSQLTVGDMANVEGSGFNVDEKGLRHFVMYVDPGKYDLTGKNLET